MRKALEGAKSRKKTPKQNNQRGRGWLRETDAFHVPQRRTGTRRVDRPTLGRKEGPRRSLGDWDAHDVRCPCGRDDDARIRRAAPCSLRGDDAPCSESRGATDPPTHASRRRGAHPKTKRAEFTADARVASPRTECECDRQRSIPSLARPLGVFFSGSRRLRFFRAPPAPQGCAGAETPHPWTRLFCLWI